MRWVNKVARGKNNLCQMIRKSKFVEGGTIGPVKIKPNQLNQKTTGMGLDK
ncbi:MAG: hypothetical protein ACJAR1_002249 [Rubritalea sp.]|jgi:hypothetical protein